MLINLYNGLQLEKLQQQYENVLKLVIFKEEINFIVAVEKEEWTQH